MKTKSLLGSFLAIACLLLLTVSVSADEIVSDVYVEVNGVDSSAYNVSVVAGESVTLKIWFTAAVDDTDVRVEAEIEGDKVSEDVMSGIFDVESGHRYKKTLTLQVPYELKDQVSDTALLSIEIDGADHRTELGDITLRVQRPSYNADIMSINTPQSARAGELVAIDVVLKNRGYNNLDDLYLTARLPALNVEKTTYIGDLVSVEDEDDDDDEDTLSARIYLRVPYTAPAGIYTLEVEAENSDLVISETTQLAINNDFVNNLIVSEFRKTFQVGGEATYKLLIINPTDSVKAYRVVLGPTGDLSASLSESIVAVQPDSSREVTLTVTSDSAGDHQFDVGVFSGEELVGQATLSANVEREVAADAVVVLTIVLVIIFVVLLVVLVVLLRRRPEVAEEFGESYY